MSCSLVMQSNLPMGSKADKSTVDKDGQDSDGIYFAVCQQSSDQIAL